MSKKLTRQQRSRAVTLGALALMIVLFAWSWYQHGWQHFAIEALVLGIGAVVLVATLLWVNGGER